MAYLKGSKGYVMLSVKQDTFGTAKAPTITGTISAGEDLKIQKASKQVLTDRIRNKVAPDYVQLGRTSVAGTLTYDFIPNEAMALNLAMVLGSNNTVSGSATTGYTHTFNAWSACTGIPQSGVTIQKLVGGCTNVMLADYISMFANSLELTIPEDGIVTYAVNYMGVKNQYGVSTLATPSYSNVNPFEGWMAKVSVGATIGAVADVAMKECKLTINNNQQMITDHNASNQYPSGFAMGTRTVEMEITITQEDNLTFYNYFKDDTVNAVQLTLTHPTLAGSSSGVHSLTVKLPRVTWLGDEPTLDSADVITATYKLQALWDTTTGYDIQAVLVDGVTGVLVV